MIAFNMSYKTSESIQGVIDSIKDWIKDFKKTQPGNLEIDTDTFEGSAYHLLTNAKNWLKEYQEELENSDQ